MAIRTSALRATIPMLIVAAGVCGRVAGQQQHRATGARFPFAKRIGWVDGLCLAISNANLAVGSPLTLIVASEPRGPQRVEQARIKGRTNSPEACDALKPGRAEVNAREGTSFYALEGRGIGSTDIGVGIVAPPAAPHVVNGLARVDLDQNGQSEVFSTCATIEGISFGVWTGKAYQGKPLWSGYYYLNYDTEPTCPESRAAQTPPR